MKQYKYVRCDDIEDYNGWEIVKIIPGEEIDYVVLMKEDKPIQNYIKLHEATNEQLIEELMKRLKENE